MSNDWIEVSLGEFIELKRGYDLPKSKRSPGQAPIVSSAGISDYHSEAKVLGPGVITGRYGTIGEVFFLEEDFWPLNTTLYVSDFKGNSPRFVYYLLKTFNFHKYSDKAAVPGVNRNHLHMENVRVPVSYEQQETLASFLSHFDQKIQLNTQTNQTLEAMAQAIFKSWFVDFDPVKAKMQGKQPEGMDADTAALFPDKLVESELGLIPEGWEVRTLSSLINITGGGTPKRSEHSYWNGNIPWFSVKDVPSGSNIFVVDTNEKITELGLNKSSTKLLPKGTTIITARGTVGKLALVGTDMCMNQSCYGMRGKDVGDLYNYFNLKEAISTLQRNTHGAVFDTITTKTFNTYSLAFGGIELANRFDALVSPILQRVEANVRQNIELATLRDTLLPKLLSGELPLEQAEKLAEVS